jgi:hypothetical protein
MLPQRRHHRHDCPGRPRRWLEPLPEERQANRIADGTRQYQRSPSTNGSTTTLQDELGAPLEIVGLLFLNASGDFVTVELELFYPDGEIIEAVDLSTAPVPEPGSILLFGTGVLAAVGVVRRKAGQFD